MVSGEESPNSHRPAEGRMPVDPAQVHTRAELAAAFDGLRGTRSYGDLDRAVGGHGQKEPKGSVLKSSTISNLLSGKSVPSEATVKLFLTACGQKGAAAQGPWLAAWERVATNHLRRPAAAVRVRDAEPQRLGVHPSIQVAGSIGELPYVARDRDPDVRNAITSAGAGAGGFVLITGSSSVGKTRTLYEAVRAKLSEWWLLRPGDAAAVCAFATEPAPRTVLWLDELQRYLDGPGGLPVGTVERLLAAGVLVVATVWSDEYSRRTSPRASDGPDPYANDRVLLGLAHVIDLEDAFTDDERGRAELLAADSRIRTALNTTDAGFTQVLAAGPDLIRWWEMANVTDPGQCCGKAVITAALDARRAGATAAVTSAFLTAAAPAYLTAAQRGAVTRSFGNEWLEVALEYASTPQHGATSCLTAVAEDIGGIIRWVTADYLNQYARAVRRTCYIPDRVWQALVQHHDPDDCRSLTDSAERRGHQDHARSFARLLPAPPDTAEYLESYGNEARVSWFMLHGTMDGLMPGPDEGEALLIRNADRLAELGRIEELTRMADAGDLSAITRHAARVLAGWLRMNGKLDELQQRAAARDEYALDEIHRWLAEEGHLDELRIRADIGYPGAARHLLAALAQADLVHEIQGEVNAGTLGAVQTLQSVIRPDASS